MNALRILALDGGGIRGAFGAAFLAELEKNIDGPLYEYFDLVVGTSTGGIIALAIALGMPASDMKAFYAKQGPQIFGRSQRSFLGPVFQPWYSNRALIAALDSAFGERRMKSARTRVVIPAVDLVSGKPTTFKTPHLRDASTRDPEMLVKDIALATTAAPVYFPAAPIGEHGALHCDGGLWANNPAMVGYVESQRLRVGGEFGQPSQPSILSVGTGQRTFLLSPPKSAGLRWWSRRLLPTMLDVQSAGTEYMAGFVFGQGNYRRVDFPIPDPSWTLDNARHLDELMHLGAKKAHEHLRSLRRDFFAVKAEAARWATG